MNIVGISLHFPSISGLERRINLTLQKMMPNAVESTILNKETHFREEITRLVQEIGERPYRVFNGRVVKTEGDFYARVDEWAVRQETQEAELTASAEVAQLYKAITYYIFRGMVTSVVEPIVSNLRTLRGPREITLGYYFKYLGTLDGQGISITDEFMRDILDYNFLKSLIAHGLPDDKETLIRLPYKLKSKEAIRRFEHITKKYSK